MTSHQVMIALKFKELNHVYHGLADRDRRHKVTLYYDNYNYNLMKKLYERDYLTSFDDDWYNDGKEHRIIGWVRKDTSITG